MVDWECISETHAPGTSSPATGNYFVTGTFNYWEFKEMTPDWNMPGTYHAAVHLHSDTIAFQIVRNEDWLQMIYPTFNGSCGEGDDVLGPDDEGRGMLWRLDGKIGDMFDISFQRLKGDSGWDSMAVSWRKIGSESLSKAQIVAGNEKKFFVVGSWDGFRSRKEMVKRGLAYVTEVELGDDADARFQILVNGDWGAVLHPDVPDAAPFEAHAIAGPSVEEAANCWMIRMD